MIKKSVKVCRAVYVFAGGGGQYNIGDEMVMTDARKKSGGSGD